MSAQDHLPHACADCFHGLWRRASLPGSNPEEGVPLSMTVYGLHRFVTHSCPHHSLACPFHCLRQQGKVLGALGTAWVSSGKKGG